MLKYQMRREEVVKTLEDQKRERLPLLPSPTEKVGERESRKITLGDKEKETGKGKKKKKSTKGQKNNSYTGESLMTSANSRLENCCCRYAQSLAFDG